MRFNPDCKTIEEAKEYYINRAIQMLYHGYTLRQLLTVNKQIVRAIFVDSLGKEYQSLYILSDFKNQGLYTKYLEPNVPVITKYDCNIEEYLIKKNIEHVFCDDDYNLEIEYAMINKMYGDQKSKRSGVYLMNHIDEGVYILKKIGANLDAIRGYIVHPIFQDDNSFKELNDQLDAYRHMGVRTIVNAIEYRNIANAYLSSRSIKSIDEIALSPLKDVNDMLIADKIQNYKDFMLYHYGKHPRTKELYEYFHNWFKRLGLKEDFILETIKEISLGEINPIFSKDHNDMIMMDSLYGTIERK